MHRQADGTIATRERTLRQGPDVPAGNNGAARPLTELGIGSNPRKAVHEARRLRDDLADVDVDLLVAAAPLSPPRGYSGGRGVPVAPEPTDGPAP